MIEETAVAVSLADLLSVNRDRGKAGRGLFRRMAAGRGKQLADKFHEVAAV
jgi:hypothetical protein